MGPDVSLSIRLSWWTLPLQGVPPKHRAWVWSEVSGAAAKQKEQMNNYYEAMVHMGEACSIASHQIELVSASGPGAGYEHRATCWGRPGGGGHGPHRQSCALCQRQEGRPAHLP